MSDETKKPGKSLDEAAIKTTRMDRRAMLRGAGIAGLGAGALGLEMWVRTAPARTSVSAMVWKTS